MKKVNYHTHLEFSYFNYINRPEANSFTKWLEKIISFRFLIKDELRILSIKNILKKYKDYIFWNIQTFTENEKILRLLKRPNIKNFFEFIGLDENIAKNRFEKYIKLARKYNFFLSAHAPYSVHPKYIKLIYKFTPIFKIHCAESKEEVDFLLGKKNDMFKLFKKLGVLGNFKPPKKRPVEYLYSLKVLSPKTYLVHCTNITEKEAYLIKKSGAKVIICPRSNFYLKVGFPNLNLFKKYKIPVLLGTDSLASNEDLDLKNELLFLKRFLKENYNESKVY